jgi:hypothetical protein
MEGNLEWLTHEESITPTDSQRFLQSVTSIKLEGVWTMNHDMVRWCFNNSTQFNVKEDFINYHVGNACFWNIHQQ